MMRSYLPLFVTLMSLYCASVAHAQESLPTAAVPKLVRFNGSLKPAFGRLAPSTENVTLAVYREQTGGAPLWQEVQNVEVDAEGRYSLLMGSTINEGVPVSLFAGGEPRWLGVQVNRPGEIEQSRVLMVSVPYALKASDSETLGGLPASAYLRAEASANPTSGNAGTSTTTSTSTTAAVSGVKPKATSGTAGFIGVFTNTTDLGNSVMQQANGTIGVGTVPGLNAATVPSLDLRTNPFSQIGMGQTTDYLTFFASDAFGPAIYWNPGKDLRFGKGGAGLYNAFGFTEQMRIQSSTGNVGIGTQGPGSKLDVAGDVNFTGSLRFQTGPVLTLPGGGGATNTALGLQTMIANTTGLHNTALGYAALEFNTTGSFNAAGGLFALFQNTTGSFNTAYGGGALQANISGSANTATGFQALGSNTAGNNTATGYRALASNTTGSTNTAHGVQALEDNTTGGTNTATGYQALRSNTSGGANTAEGDASLASNTTGVNNTAVGAASLTFNSTGSNNTAIGAAALQLNTTGTSNIAVGPQALEFNTGGLNNIAIGLLAAGNVSGGNSNNIHIGNIGASSDSGVIKIGTSPSQTTFFAAGIRGVTTGVNNAIPVMIDGNGQLGTVSSSGRFKEDIQDMGAASSNLMRLRAVTYRYKQPFEDGSKPIQYGLIAEEVAEVYPDLVAHSADGQIETVKYQVLDSMLLNEVQRQQAEIRELRERLAKLEAMLSERYR